MSVSGVDGAPIAWSDPPRSEDTGEAADAPVEAARSAAVRGSRPLRPVPGQEAPTANEATLPPQVRARLDELGAYVPVFPEQTELTIRADLHADDIHDKAVATWRDKAGKKQAAYTAEFHRHNAEMKWAKVMELEPRFDKLKAQLREGALEGSEPHMIAYIIAATGLRPGNARSLEQGKYGVSTLCCEHVSIEHEDVHLEFIGKHGQPNQATIHDGEFAEALDHHMDGRAEGSLFEANARDARAILPEGIKLKDMRTIVATRTAREQVANWTGPPPPFTGDPAKDERLIAKALKTMSAAVADKLNNTPAVARSSYIHPTVFEGWVAGVSDVVPSDVGYA